MLWVQVPLSPPNLKAVNMSVETQDTQVNEAVSSLLDTEHSTCDLDSYKGKPMFVINKNSRYPFSFGLAKAKLIVKHVKQLDRFVATDGASLS
jgi:hypothetical protein